MLKHWSQASVRLEVDMHILRLAIVVVLLAVVTTPLEARPNEFVVFKAVVPMDQGKRNFQDRLGEAGRDTARMNDYYIRIGTDRGINMGMTMNVYRDEEIQPDMNLGNIQLTSTKYVGRVQVFHAEREYSICRVVAVSMPKEDPHLNRTTVMVKDYVMPVFVVTAPELFGPGMDEPLAEAYTILERATRFIEKFALRASQIRIEGHTDSDGPEDVNMDLSLRRAQSVQQILQDLGSDNNGPQFPESLQLSSVGYGETRPLSDNRTEAGKALNRRFEIVIEQ